MTGRLNDLLKIKVDMKINIKAKPSAKGPGEYPKVEKIDDLNYVVSVKEPPIKGKANEAIRNALAIYFKVASAKVRIISGHSSRNKIIEVIK